MKRERRQLTQTELGKITSRKPVVRKVRGAREDKKVGRGKRGAK